jgi:hypothetical protein
MLHGVLTADCFRAKALEYGTKLGFQNFQASENGVFTLRNSMQLTRRCDMKKPPAVMLVLLHDLVFVIGGNVHHVIHKQTVHG